MLYSYKCVEIITDAALESIKIKMMYSYHFLYVYTTFNLLWHIHPMYVDFIFLTLNILLNHNMTILRKYRYQNNEHCFGFY